MTLPHFPFYPGDYLRDTMGLSSCEHGCYLLLLMHSWSRGPLRDDLDYLQRISGNPPMQTLRYILEEYWQLVDTGWVNAKLEQIRERQLAAHQRRVDAGRRGGSAKASNARATPKQCASNAKAKLQQSPSNQNQNHISTNVDIRRFTPPSLEQVAEYCRQRGNSVDPQAFVDHYTATGWVRGKTKIKDWRACVRTWEKSNAKGRTTGSKGAAERNIDLDDYLTTKMRDT